MADLEITFNTVSLPANTSGTLTVREDVGDDGTIDNTNSTSLSDGVTSYILSGFDGSSGNAIEPEVSLDNSDDVSTATVSEPTDISVRTTISGTGVGTESYTWNTESEWNDGTFTDTTTDGSGTLILEPLTSLSFDWSLKSTDAAGTSDNTTTSVEIRDTSSETVLASQSLTASGEQVSDSGTFTIDVGTHEDLTFEASLDTSSDIQSECSASISGPIDGTDTTIVSVSSTSNNDSQTDTQSEVYEYVVSGSWTSPDYVFDETTTMTRVAWSGVQYPNSGDDITVTVENADASSTASVSLSSGSGEALIEIPADSTYQGVVDISSASDDTTPTLGSLTLETHTPPSGFTITDTRSTAVDFSWTGVSVSDGYEIYYSTSSGVTASDTLGFDTTNSGTTTATVSGLDQGTTYHFNIRAQYSGE